MPGDNDQVIPLANATGGCAVTAILPQGAELKALRNRGAWPIHGDRTLVEPPLCTPTWPAAWPPFPCQIGALWARAFMAGRMYHRRGPITSACSGGRRVRPVPVPAYCCDDRP
jgi:hypothetical protein